MIDRINLYGESISIGSSGRTTPAADGRRANAATFDSLLKKELDGIRLSAHAEERLRSSRIELTQEHMDRLKGAVSKAAAKGARESLILLDDLALVVSVKNRTVITAIAPDRIRENVFTNIDSAVIG